MFIYEINCSQSFNFHSKQIKIFILKYSEYRPVLSKNVIGFLNETEIGGFGMTMTLFARNLVFLLVFIHLLLLVVLPPHVPVFFWPSRHNFRDIELKFCIFSQLSYLKHKNFLYILIKFMRFCSICHF